MPDTDWLTRLGWFLTGNWNLIRDCFLAIVAAVTAILLYRRTRATEDLAKAALEQAKVASQQTDIASRRHEEQSDAERQRRITESFARATEQLGSEKAEVRIGAIYALERIARESSADHWPIMETLTAYVREKVPLPYPDKDEVEKVKKDVEKARWRLPADTQAALTVIGRRRVEQDASELTLQLHGTNLARANLQNAHLERANLTGAFLTGALLAGTHLENADLSDAQLQGAILHHTELVGAFLKDADLEGAFIGSADLSGADLSGASLRRADLTSAKLRGANLSKARLYEAHLNEADLSGSILSEADLSEADLTRTNLNGADLRGVRVSISMLLAEEYFKLSKEKQDEYRNQAQAYLLQEQLNKACGNAETKLPEGLTVRFCDS